MGCSLAKGGSCLGEGASQWIVSWGERRGEIAMQRMLFQKWTGRSQVASPPKLSLPLEWDPAAESRIAHPTWLNRTLTTMDGP